MLKYGVVVLAAMGLTEVAASALGSDNVEGAVSQILDPLDTPPFDPAKVNGFLQQYGNMLARDWGTDLDVLDPVSCLGCLQSMLMSKPDQSAATDPVGSGDPPSVSKGTEGPRN